jgi:hypothetical protein
MMMNQLSKKANILILTIAALLLLAIGLIFSSDRAGRKQAAENTPADSETARPPCIEGDNFHIYTGEPCP